MKKCKTFQIKKIGENISEFSEKSENDEQNDLINENNLIEKKLIIINYFKLKSKEILLF